FFTLPLPQISTLFPYTTLFRSIFSELTFPNYSLETPCAASQSHTAVYSGGGAAPRSVNSWRCFDNSFISVVRSSATYLKSALRLDRKSTRLNSSHVAISYAVFC